MSLSIPPEIFMFIGVNVFVAMSLLISIFEEPFPKALPYVFQIAALAGFGQIWANYAFLSGFVEARFWSSMFYLAAAMINVVGINLYIAFKKKLLSIAGMILGSFTIPTGAISFLLISAYVNGIPIPMPWLPIVPLGTLYVVLVLCAVILGLSILVYAKPNFLERALKAIKKREESSPIEFKAIPQNDQENIDQEEVKMNE